jgi:protein-disulfide isomerase
MLSPMQRNRLLLLAAAAGVAILVVVVVVAFTGSGGSGSAATTTRSTSGSAGGSEATSTFAGVPQNGDTLGRASADATMYLYEDPQCPFCRQFNIDTLPTVVQNYVRDGKLKLVYRGIVVIDDQSLLGIAAAYAAGRQHKLWQMVEALYERQGQERSGWLTLGVVKDAGKEIGVDLDQLVKDMKSAAVATEMQRSAQEASNLGVRSTPTFGIQKPLGTIQQLQISSLEPDGFTPALDSALS